MRTLPIHRRPHGAAGSICPQVPAEQFEENRRADHAYVRSRLTQVFDHLEVPRRTPQYGAKPVEFEVFQPARIDLAANMLSAGDRISLVDVPPRT